MWLQNDIEDLICSSTYRPSRSRSVTGSIACPLNYKRHSAPSSQNLILFPRHSGCQEVTGERPVSFDLSFTK